MRLAALALVALTSRAPAADAPMTEQQLVQAVEARYRDVQSLRAEFTQVTRSVALGTEVQQTGRVFLRRPRMMRMEFSDSKLVVSDGKRIWVYNPDANQVYVYRDLGAGAGSGVLLDDLDSLDEHFQVRLLPSEEARPRFWVLELAPKDDAPFKTLRVEVTRKNYTIRRVTIIDQMDNVTEIRLNRVRLNAAVGDDLFHFEPPEGAQVIEGQ